MATHLCLDNIVLMKIIPKAFHRGQLVWPKEQSRNGLRKTNIKMEMKGDAYLVHQQWLRPNQQLEGAFGGNYWVLFCSKFLVVAFCSKLA